MGLLWHKTAQKETPFGLIFKSFQSLSVVDHWRVPMYKMPIATAVKIQIESVITVLMVSGFCCSNSQGN